MNRLGACLARFAGGGFAFGLWLELPDSPASAGLAEAECSGLSSSAICRFWPALAIDEESGILSAASGPVVVADCAGGARFMSSFISRGVKRSDGTACSDVDSDFKAFGGDTGAFGTVEAGDVKYGTSA